MKWKTWELVLALFVVSVFVLAADELFFAPDSPDAPVAVEYDYQQGLRDGMLATLKFDNFCYSGKSTTAQRDSASKEMAALLKQDGPPYADSIENDTIPLVRSDPCDDHYHRVGMAKLTSPPRYGPMPGTKKPSHPDPCAGMVSIEAVDSLLYYFVDMKPTVYGGSDWDGTGPPYSPDTSVVTIDYLEWQRLKEARE